MHFSTWLLQLETAFIFDSFFWGKNYLITKTMPLEVLQHSFWIFWEVHAFFKMLASIGTCIIVWNRIESPFWEMYVTAFFKRIASSRKCSILQRNMHALIWRCKFQYQSTTCFCLGCSSYQKCKSTSSTCYMHPLGDMQLIWIRNDINEGEKKYT